jgi:CheY-like chemotaxis protein
VNQKVALAMLRKRGYDADVAADGIEALDMLKLRHYDAVFMDVQMPRMDGLEATRQICARWSSDERPWIIGMTAHAMEEDREACLAAGMNDYIAKPVTLDKLAEALATVHRTIGARPPARVESHVDGDPLPAPGVAGSAVDVNKLEQLKRTVGDDQLASFIDEFLDDSNSLLERITSAAQVGDAADLTKAAHMLRSTSALIGALDLTEICITLERSGKKGDVSQAPELAQRARALFTGVEADLGRLVSAA